MRFNKMSCFSISLFICVLSSCCKRDPVNIHYFISIYYQGWDTKLFVNTNPILREGGGILTLDFTPFVKKGKNSIKILSKRIKNSKDQKLPCYIKIFKTKNPLKKDSYTLIGSITEQDPKKDEHSLEFSFECPNTYKWYWEDGKQLGNLTASDKKNILMILDKFEKPLKEKDPTPFFTLQKHLWRENPTPKGLFVKIPGLKLGKSKDDYFDNLKKKMLSTEFVVRKATKEDIKFDIGKKIVMISTVPIAENSTKLSLLSLEFKKKKKNHGTVVSFGLGFPYLLFIRKSDTWEPLDFLNIYYCTE